MRFLLLFANDNGEPQAALLTFPHGTDEDGAVALFPTIIANMGNCNDASNISFVELPGEFRPAIYDRDGDEMALTFIDV